MTVETIEYIRRYSVQSNEASVDYDSTSKRECDDVAEVLIAVEDALKARPLRELRIIGYDIQKKGQR